MIAYKLFKKRKDKTLGPLFINKKQHIPYNTWLIAECHPTKGYKVRKGWHCTSEPIAPHLRDDPDSGRVWLEVEIEDYEELQRPKNQGGLWYIAQKMKVIKKL